MDKSKQTPYTSPKMKIPAPTFAGFVKGLASEVFIHLGRVENPITRTKVVNFDLAKYTITLIELLRTKTKGNLSTEDETLIDHLLIELNAIYEEAVKGTEETTD